MSNSSLISYTKISPNRTSPRNHKIDTITIHCYVGQVSVESMAGWLCNSAAQASANYGIGSDGRIGMFVEEKDRSWCSSNRDNDHRAITIECASDTAHPYAINDRVYNSLIRLCADICQRNGIKKLLWRADKSLIGQVDKQNMTVHRWFANKACPGDYIYNRLGTIAAEVNDIIGASQLYRVRNNWANPESQIGAYSSLDNAKKAADQHPGYSVYDSSGKAVYTRKGEDVRYAWVNQDGAKVRKKAGATNAQCSFSPLTKGTRVQIIRSTKSPAGNLWYQVEWKSGKRGYIWGKRLSFSYIAEAGSMAKRAAANAKAIAKDDFHGYNNTTGKRAGAPDYACSSFVADCYIKAGVDFGIPASKVYTKDMRKLFTSHGFKNVTSKVNLKTGNGMKEGDVVVKPGSHTEIYVGNGKLAGARGNANSGRPENGKAGDQSGGEIAISSYWYFGQTICLRYSG